MLRKRLADRARAGGDVGASMAADEVLAEVNQGRSLASLARDHRATGAGAVNEQAGPQAVDSEPLFSRVHHAHKRFEKRHYPEREASL